MAVIRLFRLGMIRDADGCVHWETEHTLIFNRQFGFLRWGIPLGFFVPPPPPAWMEYRSFW